MSDINSIDQEDYYSADEVKKMLDDCFYSDRNLLLWHARGLCKKIEIIDPEELMHEAYLRFRDGRRKWKRGVEFIQTFIGAMKSISSNEREKKDNKISSMGITSDTFAVGVEPSNSDVKQLPDTENLIEQIEDKQVIISLEDKIAKSFKGDPLLTEFFKLWCKNYSKKEIKERLNINDQRYHSLYMQFQRRIELNKTVSF